MHLRSIGLAAALVVGSGPCTPDESPKDAPRVLDSAGNGGAKDAGQGSRVPRPDAAPPRAPSDLDVVLITIDCLRADMPWAGYERPIAPRLTDLASRAVQYTHAYSMSSYTSMSLGGLLGGKLPGEMRRDGYFFGVYAKENVLFPELLQSAGIHTLAAHAHGYFHDAGFDQGFDRWEVVPNLKWSNTTDENITSPELEALAEKLLSEPAVTETRFFAWFHFLDPHDRYLPHPGIGPYGDTPRDRYDAEVTFTDRYIGKLLDFIAAKPWGARTAIIVTADHGEAFGEHHQYVHGFELWENLVRVPSLFVLPGVPARKIDSPRSAVDLAPTLLELLGVARDAALDGGATASFEGSSLVPELYGAAPAPRDVVVDLPETSDNDRRRALVHDTLKIIAFGKDTYFQVFDLASDPSESKPITKGDVFEEMLARYKAFEKTVKDVPPMKCNEGCLNGAYARKDAGR
jgi:arylsulfatase A-like enzyme